MVYSPYVTYLLTRRKKPSMLKSGSKPERIYRMLHILAYAVGAAGVDNCGGNLEI